MTDEWTPDVVRTQWGFVTPQALWRLTEAYKQAIDQGRPSFEIDGNPYVTSFANHLIEYCRNEGLKPIRGDGTEPIFTESATRRDPSVLLNLLKGHLDTITGAMVESDGTIYCQKDGKTVAVIQWPEIIPDIQALVARRVS